LSGSRQTPSEPTDLLRNKSAVDPPVFKVHPATIYRLAAQQRLE
jgi:hypothetical protein